MIHLGRVEAAIQLGWIIEAMGLSAETKTLQEIKSLFAGGITGYNPASFQENPFYLQAIKDGKVPPRYLQSPLSPVSDDSALTLAGIKCITDGHGLDLYQLFGYQAREYKYFGSRGFGSGTGQVLQGILDGNTLPENGNVSTYNGVLIKQFPYALYFVLNQTLLKDQEAKIVEITRVTHNHPVSIIISLLHNYFLTRIISSQDTSKIDMHQLLDEMHGLSCAYEGEYMGNQYPGKVKPSQIVDKLRGLYENTVNGKGWDNEKILEEFIIADNDRKGRPGFHVTSTFGIVYAIFLQHLDKSTGWEGLLRAINIGEDTDSQGSVIGNMLGAYHGQFFDLALLDGLTDKVYLQQALAKFLGHIRINYPSMVKTTT